MPKARSLSKPIIIRRSSVAGRASRVARRRHRHRHRHRHRRRRRRRRRLGSRARARGGGGGDGTGRVGMAWCRRTVPVVRTHGEVEGEKITARQNSPPQEAPLRPPNEPLLDIGWRLQAPYA